jgi:hypothetical protein
MHVCICQFDLFSIYTPAVYLYLSVYERMFVCIYICLHVCVCMHEHMGVSIYLSVCVSILLVLPSFICFNLYFPLCFYNSSAETR